MVFTVETVYRNDVSHAGTSDVIHFDWTSLSRDRRVIYNIKFK